MDGTSDIPVTETSVTITDDDVASSGIVLSASPSLVSEDGGAVPVSVTASLNGAVREAATTVTVSVAGSGNPQAVDFQAVADFEIKIAANAANGEGTFTLTPVDDGAVEADETLAVSGASDLPVTPTTVTLADDDDASTRILLSAVPGRVSEGDGPTPVTVTATLDRALRQQATTVTVSVSGSGDAASGDAGAGDFVAVPDFTITIPANAASGTATFTLRPEDDATVEADERLRISGVSDLPVAPAAVTLVDDDEESTRILLFLAVDPPLASEGDGEIRVTVTAAVDKDARPDDTRVRVSVSGSGDPEAVDFAAVEDFEIVIPANARNGTGTFTVVPEDDLIVEADEVVTVSGVSDLPVGPATMKLLDDDEASGRILLSADPARVSEGDGPVAVTVTASLDRGLRQSATTVTVTVSGGGDPDAADFAAVADFAITIPANAASGEGTFTLTPEDDAMVESDETLTVSGASDLPVTPTAVTLADDDEVSTRILLFLTVDPHAGVGRRRRDTRDRDGGGGQGRAPGRDADSGGGVGQRRSERGGLRRGDGLRDRDPGECPERDGDVHRGAGRRRDPRGGRGADDIRRLRSAGEPGDLGTAGRRRGVRAHPAVGRSGAGVRRRRPGGGDGDRVWTGVCAGRRTVTGCRAAARRWTSRRRTSRRDSGDPERDGDVTVVCASRRRP